MYFHMYVANNKYTLATEYSIISQTDRQLDQGRYVVHGDRWFTWVSDIGVVRD